MTIPILGNCYYCYSDEAGHMRLDDEGELFCFATFAIYRHSVDEVALNGIKIVKGKHYSIKNYKPVAQILNKVSSLISIVSLNLSDSDVRDRIKESYAQRVAKSNLSQSNKPSIRNYAWGYVYVINLVKMISELILQHNNIGTIFPFHHQVTLKKREQQAMTHIMEKTMPSNFEKAIFNTEKKMGVKVPLEMQPYLLASTALPKEHVGVKLIDSVVSGYRQSVLMGRADEFRGLFSNLLVQDLTGQFCVNGL